jgi:hypothetical protein
MPSDRRKSDPLSGFFDAGDDPRRRRRVVGVPGTGPSGPAMSGGPSGPAMRGPSGPAMRGPSGPAMSGGGPGAAEPTRRRKSGGNDDLMKQLYG